MSDVAALLAQLANRTDAAPDPALAAVRLARASIDALVLKLGQTVEATVTAQLAGGLTQLSAGNESFVLKLATPLPISTPVTIKVTTSPGGQPAVTVTQRATTPPSAPAPALSQSSVTTPLPPPPEAPLPPAPQAANAPAPAQAPLPPQQAAGATPPAAPVATSTPAATSPPAPSLAPRAADAPMQPSATAPTVIPAQTASPPPTPGPPLRPAAPERPAPSALAATPTTVAQAQPNVPGPAPAPVSTASSAPASANPPPASVPSAAPTQPQAQPAVPSQPPVSPAAQAPAPSAAPATPYQAAPALASQPTQAVVPPSPAPAVRMPVPTASAPALTPTPSLQPGAPSPAVPRTSTAPPAPTPAASPAPATPQPQPLTSPRPVVPAVPSLPLAQVLADPVQTVVRQDTIAPLMAKAAAIIANPAIASALPRPVLEAIVRTLAGRIDLNRAPLDAGALREAVLQSGTLRQLPGQPATSRDTLLALRSVLSGFLGGEIAAVAPVASKPPPPLKGEPARAPQPMPPLPLLEEAPDDVARELLGHTDAALARTKLLQQASGPDPRPSATAPIPEFRFEIPMLLGTQTGILQLMVERDGRNKLNPRERGWRMRFALNFSATGEVGADIALLGRATNIALWAAEPETADTLEAMLPELAPALASHGLDIAGLRVRLGAPQRRAHLPGQLLDSAR